MQNIHELVRQTRDEYQRNDIDTVEGLSFNMYDRIIENEFLTSGHYMSGDYDENGDLKPFHDIITRILENQRTAEEVDTKDMDITTDDPDYYVRASLISKFNQDWMDENHMDKFHNDAIEIRGKHGGLLVKVTEDSDDLSLEVTDWTSFSGDAADLENGVKVVDNFYTPSDLVKKAEEMSWDMEAVHRAIKLYAIADQDDEYKEQRETTGKYVLVREVSGTLERTYIDEDAEEYEYSYQVHYVAGSEFHDDKGEKGVTLDSQELEESPYYYLPYKKRTSAGKMLGIGMVERARHSQISTNVAAQQYKYSLDLASTHLLQSSSKNLKGKNVITNVKRGSILKHDDGKPISSVDMSPQALAHLQGYMAQWQNQVDRATGTFAVATGEELPSGTPYRLGAIMDQNAQSSFDLRREEYAIFLNRIYKERVIPFLIRQIRKKDTLKLKFSPEELKDLDRDTANYRVDRELVKQYLDGEFDNVPPAMKFAVMDVKREEMLNEVDGELKKGKNRRNVTDFPDRYWADVADKLYVNITGERKDKATMLESVNNVLMQYIQLKPQLDLDPNARKLFNQIVETAGLEPIDFAEGAPTPPQQVQAPQQNAPIDNPEELTAKPQ